MARNVSPRPSRLEEQAGAGPWEQSTTTSTLVFSRAQGGEPNEIMLITR